MKPQFALSLSFEGIRLLHRAAGGWLDVGGVTLNADDLAGELANLRKTASSLEPGGVRTKLIIPNDQIKYLSIDTKGFSRKQRVEAARKALVAATPYKVRDLSFDICPDGPKTHVAAVANETLVEAEAFAAEHNFNPVSFVAIPGNEAFMGEPFFGPTQGAQTLLSGSEKVEPDGIAVVVVGTVAASTISEIVSAAPEPETGADTPPEPLPETAATPDSRARAEEPAAEGSEDKQTATAAQDPKPEPKPEPDTDALEAAETGADTAADMPVKSKATTREPSVLAKAMAEAKARAGSTRPAAGAPTDEDADTDVAVSPAADIAAPTIADPEEADAAEQNEDPGEAGDDGAAAASSFASRRSTDKAPLTASKDPDITTSAPPIDATLHPDSSSLDHPPPPVEAPAAVRDAPVAAMPEGGAFLSRRKPGAIASPVAKRPVAAAEKPIPAPEDEADRLTVFGARREAEVGGKPRFLGLILTVVLLVFLAGVAAWAAVFLDDGLAGLFQGRDTRTVASDPEYQIEPQIIRTSPEPAENTQVAALDPDLSEEDSAVLDALSEPEPAPPVPVMTEAEADARYAVSGIWPLPPKVPTPPGTIPIDDFYLTSIDPVSTASDAVALPTARSFATDNEVPAIASPAAPGTNFALDARGMVIPTAAGAVSPDGVVVFLGRPPLVPPVTPTRFQTEPEVDTERTALAGLRPRERPGNLAESNERAQLDGLTRNELAGYRPELRPQSIQQAAEAAETQQAAIAAAAAAAAAALETQQDAEPEAPAATPFASATQYAVNRSARPDVRPRNFDRIVKRAQRNTPKVTQTAGTVAPRAVAPTIPSKASVAKQATINNALNLRKVNLIGVYGKPSSRRALVRLGNGRYKKVVVGDRIDGGRVSAIGDSELRYTKGGRAVVLKMPKG